jgi:3-carboxy-cis,cis-muconate cycloisomerase
MSLQAHGPLFENTFTTPETREVFGTEGYVDRFVRVEAALAIAEASVGMVPEDAASTLAERASAEHVDMEAVERYLEQWGLLSMAIIEGWRENLGDEGRFVHWGSTSQDVMDTTVVL